MSLSKECKTWIQIFLSGNSAEEVFLDYPGLMIPPHPGSGKAARRATVNDLSWKNYMFYICYTSKDHPKASEIEGLCMSLIMDWDLNDESYLNFFQMLLAE